MIRYQSLCKKMKQNIRQAAVAGMFYPADPSELTLTVNALFRTATTASSQQTPPCPRAIIAPHAGYIYSGPTAAKAYLCLQNCHSHYNKVVLLGPSHRVAVNGLALSSADSYQTPLGTIPLDIDTMQALDTYDFVSINDLAHRDEHSLEVHLPFLQTTLDKFSLVPIVVGDIEPSRVAKILELFENEEHTLIVISTDLSHFHQYADAQRRDQNTSAAILNYDYNAIGYEDACGRNPVNGALYWAQQHHHSIELMDLRNSGDTAGDKERVVGYASYHIYK